MRIAAAVLCTLLLTCAAQAQPPDAGRRQYELVCSRCHGGDGNDCELGPGIVTRLFARDDERRATLVRDGLPAAGMPGFPIPDQDMRALVAFLRVYQACAADNVPVAENGSRCGEIEVR
jgi:mono/diheme cytochrome c family protein